MITPLPPPLSLAASLGANDIWTIATACACSVACGTIGCYLVLRRMSMLGDAISHALVPGLAAAFLLSGSRDVLPMLIGAGIAGLVTAVSSAALSRAGKLAEDASLGVVFTTLFALGVVLMSFLPASLDIDPGCVLYGNLEAAPLNTMSLWGITVPDTLPRLTAFALLNIVVLTLFFKEIKIVAFDPGLAAAMGIRAGAVHAGMLALVAATSVVSFEAVGSVLVVAMLIAPGATAHLLTDRLSRMFLWAAALAISAATLGYLFALWLNCSVAGMISVVAGAQFALTAAAAPRHGIIARIARRALLSSRITREDILGMLYRWQEHNLSAPLQTTDIFAALAAARWSRGRLIVRIAIHQLHRAGLITGDRAGLSLTAKGRDAAVELVRAHRLWERFLADRIGLPADHVHAPSHRTEHFIGPRLQRALASEVGEGPDPHGKPIPAPR